MHIAIITHEYHPFDGGVARYVQEMSREAVRQGHSVVIHAPDYGRADAPTAEGAVRIVRFRGDRFRPRRDLLRYVAALHRFLGATPADIIHLADWPPLLALPLAPGGLARLRAGHGVATLYGTDARILGLHRPTAALARRTLSACRRIAAISAYTARLASEALPGIPQPEVVHLGVSPRWRASPLEPRDPLIVLAVGRVVPDKGHPAVIAGLGRLPAALRRRVRYVLVGRGHPEYLASLQAQAAEAEVALELCGRLEDDALLALYRRASVHVLASRQHAGRVEGFGLVILEAALAGVPTIGTRVGGITELIRDGETGYLVEQDDAAAIAAAVERLVCDPALRRRLGAAAASHAAAFTWERTARMTYAR